MNNNKMERMNGEIRDREKTLRGLKTEGTAILKGYQLFHNYIRPHKALDGKTPSEACGITVEGKEQVENADSERKQQAMTTAYFEKQSKIKSVQKILKRE